jgi:hypothetical protein
MGGGKSVTSYQQPPILVGYSWSFIMAEPESSHGLSCPNCGGMVPIPEGQIIVRCPFCDLRAMVRGETGVQRYHLQRKIDREQAIQGMRRFLSSHSAIAGDAARKAELVEAFVAYLPFWTGWTRVLAWIFGEKAVGSGDHKHYEPREIRVVQEMTWNGAACDVGEFGVEEAPLADQPLQPFDADTLRADGMVFEPTGSVTEARQVAEASYHARVQNSAKLDRVGQTFIRYMRKLLGVVYYPLWVLRYQYRARSFQVVVDGYSGQALYGKAPGNTFYRALMLVGGAIVGSVLAVDASAAAIYLASQAEGDTSAGLAIGGLIALVAGFGLMFAGYRAFRYGEEYEYRPSKKLFSITPRVVTPTSITPTPFTPTSVTPQVIISKLKDVESWIDRFN